MRGKDNDYISPATYKGGFRIFDGSNNKVSSKNLMTA